MYRDADRYCDVNNCTFEWKRVPVAVVRSPGENQIAETSAVAGPRITPDNPFRMAAVCTVLSDKSILFIPDRQSSVQD